ncbi:MAG: hypothetical protein NWF00_07295 [Candidatus Bathyarchaeota archaeon]|nr:hypothetical protein [Candidatus Bathyarchaeota archaeon]
MKGADYIDPEGNQFELVNGRLLPLRYLMPDGKTYVIQKIKGENKLVSFGTSNFEPLQVYKKSGFTRKQKRAYMRIKSGFTLSTVKDEKGRQKERVCFMTLSTQYDIKKDRFGRRLVDYNGRSIPVNPEARKQKIKLMNYAFTKLKQVIEYYLQKTMYERHCRKHHLEPYIQVGRFKKRKVRYQQLWKRYKFKLKYFKLKTDEGGGVMHIIFRKGYRVPKIPFDWLSKQWLRIWGSPRVNISQIAVNSADRLGRYMVGQYMQKQPILRMSYGRQWVCEGMKKSFNHIVDVYGFKRGIEVWNKQLEKGILPLGGLGRQTRFRHRRFPDRCYVTEKRYIKGQYKKVRLILPEKTQGVTGLDPQVHWSERNQNYYSYGWLQTRLDSPKYTQIWHDTLSNVVWTIFTAYKAKYAQHNNRLKRAVPS